MTETISKANFNIRTWSTRRKGDIKTASNDRRSKHAKEKEETRPLIKSVSFQDQQLRILATPKTQHYHPKTGLVHCIVRRQGRRFGQPTKIYLSLQNPDGSEQKPLLVAEKRRVKGVVQYNLHGFSLSTTELGTLSRCYTSLSLLGYALTLEGTQVATILYQVPSVFSFVVDSPTRAAQLAIATQSKMSLVKEMSYFQDACYDSIRQYRSLQAVARLEYGHVFQNKEPYQKKDGRRGLDLRGRGRRVSNKNMQLVGSDGKIVLQMAVWDKDVYHVDFGAPMTVYQAFGFALAQLAL